MRFSICILQYLKQKEPVKNPKDIVSSFNSFWTYWNKDVKLSEDFVAYNENDAIIDKEFFLNEISTGEYLPLRLQSNDSINYYKLYNITDVENNDIINTVKMYGEQYYKYFEMEDKPLPGFSYVDLNGKNYTPENCKGKIIVLNFWFIHCNSCVAEMPELNQMVNSYKDRNDILFISMAFDSKNKLEEFLKKNNIQLCCNTGY